jgi:hypothetical protein
MASVTIGRLTITEGTEEAQWGYAPEPEQSERPAVFTDTTQAVSAFGGGIKFAADTPDGFDLSVIEVLRSESLRIAVSVYRKPDQSSFQLEQAALGEPSEEEMVISPSGLRPVSIRSARAAAWTVQLPPPLLRAAPMKLGCLTWEEDGYRFLATSTCLKEDDLISIAQSL